MLNKNILIFRTDRIGDLILSGPAIVSIKKYFKNSKITLVASDKNYNYAKSLNIFDNIYRFPKNGLINKIKFIINLSKKTFDYIFVFDGKDRSYICTSLIKSNHKVALSTNLKFYHKFFNLKFFLFNKNKKIYEVYQKMINYNKIPITISNYNFLKNKTDNNFSNKLPINRYVHIHLDEKWFINLYINNYTEINPLYDDFVKFINIIAQKNNIILTTGLKSFPLLNELKKKFFKKKEEKIYYKKSFNNFIYLIFLPTYNDLESLIKNSKILIICHGSLSHVANHFDVKIVDIIEKNKVGFYNSYTHNFKNYNTVYRNDFKILQKKILSYVN